MGFSNLDLTSLLSMSGAEAIEAALGNSLMAAGIAIFSAFAFMLCARELLRQCAGQVRKGVEQNWPGSSARIVKSMAYEDANQEWRLPDSGFESYVLDRAEKLNSAGRRLERGTALFTLALLSVVAFFGMLAGWAGLGL
jgi:hypothetical protein